MISEETVAIVEGVAAEAERIETPCGAGSMVWRVWGSGPPLVLFHGGYGSWMHWIRNVLALARGFTVIAPDLPGLGESATPPEPHTAESLAAIIVEGLDIVLPREAAPHIAGFSFGGVLGGHVAAQLADRLCALTIVGSNGLGLVRQPTALERVPTGASGAEDRRACGLYPVAERAARPGEKPQVLAGRHARPCTAPGQGTPRRHLGRARCDRLSPSRRACRRAAQRSARRPLRGDRRRRALGAVRGSGPFQFAPRGNRPIPIHDQSMRW